MPRRRKPVVSAPTGNGPRQPGSEPCEIQASELSWERIQLVIRLAGIGPDGLTAAADVQLRPAGDRHEPLSARPARGDHAPNELLVRFNPFAAAGQAPLQAGRWALALRNPNGDWCAIGAAPSLTDVQAASRDFVHATGTYRIELGVAGPDSGLVLDVSEHWATLERREDGPLRRVVGGWHRLRRRAAGRLFTILVAALRHLRPRGRRRVVFSSDSRTTLGGNLELVHDRLVERGLDRRLQLRSIFKPSVRSRRSMRDRLRLVWLLASADVILLDDYQPAITRLRPRDDRRIIQLWHAWGAFKTVGYSRIGKPGGTSPYSSVHKNYTFATVSSTHEIPFYAEAFGLPEERVVATGVPRMDLFLDPERQALGRATALSAIPAARDRSVILFAPTFRGAGARQAHYPMEQIDLAGLHAVCEGRDAVVIFKMHPFVQERLEIPASYRERLIDASHGPVDVNDLLLVADLLVTDYSSLIFEYASLGRPMLFFAYDLEEYVASRDFYEPYEEFVPGRIVRTFPELLDAIKREDFQSEKVAPFARRHLPEGSGSATDRIIDELILPR